MTRNKDIKNVDRLITSLGKPGKFQIITFLFLCSNFSIIMCNHISMVFYAAKTKYHCNVDNIQLVPTVIKNNERQWDGCNIYAGNNTTETIPCPNGWTYYLEDGETNIISEFDLVCDDAYKSDLATTIYFCGVMLSGLLFGYIADKYGRKPVIGFTLFTSGLLGVGIFIFRNYVAFVILRFFLGFLMQGLQNSTFVLALEQFTSTHRGPAGLTLGAFGAVGALGFDFIAYLIRDWKYIQLTIGVLPFLQMFTLCFIPESLRWHVVDMNFRQAESIVKRTVSFNKLSFPRKLFDEIKRDSIKETHLPTYRKKANILDVFLSPQMRRISLILSVVWFTISATFYGLTFNISSLFGDKYLNFALSTLLDLVGLAAMFWAVPRYGRRSPLIFCFFSCAVANCICVVIAAVSTSANKSVNVLGTMMAIIAKSTIASTLALVYIFTSELYPTVVRNISLGMNTLWTRIGGMVAPQIFFLSLYSPLYVPYTILASLTLMSGFLTLFLPETHNMPLSDRLPEHAEVEPTTISHDDADGNSQENELLAANENILFVTSI